MLTYAGLTSAHYEIWMMFRHGGRGGVIVICQLIASCFSWDCVDASLMLSHGYCISHPTDVSQGGLESSR